ncbi:DUF1508 domain-containing protein [Rhodococcus opacus]|nr:DUF1508 domain-containing protein [Rhodococcus opacus]
MTAKFELFKDAAGKFRFHLRAANGEIIAGNNTRTAGRDGTGHRML